jgi:citrate lyase subunit beta/citryl-CoA lyase
MSLLPPKELPVWRSLLFVPVNVQKFVETAHMRGSDAVILDLEDSVPPAEKATARTLIAAAAPKVAKSGADVVVRINQPIELAVRDIEAAVSPAIHTLMLPKIDSAGHVRLLAELVDRVEAAKGMTVGHTKFMALIETPAAFARTDEIASAHPRLIAVSLGSEDFAMEIGGEAATDVLVYPKQRVAIAAVANGLMPMGVIGSVADFADLEGYRRSARLARRFGFRGSACIHPNHVKILNEEFGRRPEEVEWARRVIAVYEQAKAEGRASIQLDGKMVDIPIVVKAERILAEAERIAARAKRATTSG